MKKKVKEKSQTWYRKKCVADAKEKAKKRDNYTCQRCGRTAKQGYQMHGSHIKSEGKHRSMSADENNILTKCAQCHMWWHENPTESGKWFHEKYSELAKELDRKANTIIKVNWKLRYEQL